MGAQQESDVANRKHWAVCAPPDGKASSPKWFDRRDAALAYSDEPLFPATMEEGRGYRAPILRSDLGGDELRNSGNVGMLDLVTALEWVRDNIGQFGGNPQSVTITGQSGGGGKCSHLMAMPLARGLFHKLAIQSGSTLKTGRHEDRRKDAERLCTKLGVATGELAKLQAVAFRDIVDNQANAGPVLDGNVVPRHPFDPDAPAISAAVPMIIGTCLEDAGFTITDTSDDEASLRKWVENQLRPLKAEEAADEVLSLYRKHYPQSFVPLNRYCRHSKFAASSTLP